MVFLTKNSVDFYNQKLELCNKEMLHTKQDCSTLIVENIKIKAKEKDYVLQERENFHI
jgi:hypothetical protein